MTIWEGCNDWFHVKVLDPMFQIVSRGAEPKMLAFSTALGFTLGLFPICGVTVLLCGIAIALSAGHFHAPSMLLANFLATPVELILVVPFLRLGEKISGSPHFPLTTDALKKVITGHASTEVLISVVNALLGWIIAAPFIVGVLYFILVPIFRYLVRRYTVRPSSPTLPLLVSPRAEVNLKVRDM